MWLHKHIALWAFVKITSGSQEQIAIFWSTHHNDIFGSQRLISDQKLQKMRCPVSKIMKLYRRGSESIGFREKSSGFEKKYQVNLYRVFFMLLKSHWVKVSGFLYRVFPKKANLIKKRLCLKPPFSVQVSLKPSTTRKGQFPLKTLLFLWRFQWIFKCKSAVLKRNLTFFFAGCSKTLTVNLRFHDFLGVQKLVGFIETKCFDWGWSWVVSLKPRVSTEEEAEIEYASFNEFHQAFLVENLWY